MVADRRLRRMDVGGAALSSEDQFYGNLFVDVVPGVPVRIPSVAPQARILAARVEPQAPIELVHDGADNWFLMGSTRQRVRLVVQLAALRAVFGSPFPDVNRSALSPHAPTLPPDMKRAADEVLQRLGLSESVRPRDALTALVEYFRAFAPSDERPKTRAPAELYKELAFSKKGVCRHRAFAFVVTALALGMPARLVRNEAHAWVEAFDGSIWHRIDLGGAAGRFELESPRDVPLYGGPEDPVRLARRNSKHPVGSRGAWFDGQPAVAVRFGRESEPGCAGSERYHAGARPCGTRAPVAPLRSPASRHRGQRFRPRNPARRCRSRARRGQRRRRAVPLCARGRGAPRRRRSPGVARLSTDRRPGPLRHRAHRSAARRGRRLPRARHDTRRRRLRRELVLGQSFVAALHAPSATLFLRRSAYVNASRSAESCLRAASSRRPVRAMPRSALRLCVRCTLPS